MKYYAVFDIGGSSVKHALMDEEGKIHAEGSFRTPRTSLSELLTGMAQVAEGYGKLQKIEGIPVSAPGAVNIRTGIIEGASALPYLHGPDVRTMLEEMTGKTCRFDNDANCAALAEGFNGACRDTANYIAIVIGTGIGGAVVIDRKLVRGKHLHGGEFGFMIMEDIYKEPIGTTYSHNASTYAIVLEAAKIMNVDPDMLDGEKVFMLAESGDAEMGALIGRFYKRLAVGIYNLQYAIDPDKIVVSGAVTKRSDFFDRLNGVLGRMKNELSRLHVQVEPCFHKHNANLVGALYSYRQQLGEA
jgi:predicted NBD/HSP70 family sugar kinase